MKPCESTCMATWACCRFLNGEVCIIDRMLCDKLLNNGGLEDEQNTVKE